MELNWNYFRRIDSIFHRKIFWTKNSFQTFEFHNENSKSVTDIYSWSENVTTKEFGSSEIDMLKKFGIDMSVFSKCSTENANKSTWVPISINLPRVWKIFSNVRVFVFLDPYSNISLATLLDIGQYISFQEIGILACIKKFFPRCTTTAYPKIMMCLMASCIWKYSQY